MQILVIPMAALFDDRLTGRERRVLFALYSFAGKKTHTVWPSLESISRRTSGLDASRISKSTTRLAELGWLTKRRRWKLNHYTLMVPKYAQDLVERDAEMEILSRSKTDSGLVETTNLVEMTNLVKTTKSGLVKTTKRHLVKTTKPIELTNELTKELNKPHRSSEDEKPQINGHEKADPMRISYHSPPPQKIEPKSKPKPKPKSKPESGDATPKAVGDLYNEVLGPKLKPIKLVNTPRQRAIRARISEDPKRRSLEWWRRYFGFVEQCEFLLGHGPPRENGKPWHADFDWLINESNLTKVIEGKYAS